MNQTTIKQIFASIIGGAIAFLILFLINKGEPNALANAICIGVGCAIGIYIAFRVNQALKRKKSRIKKMRHDNGSLQD